jgi:hypothetical protein
VNVKGEEILGILAERYNVLPENVVEVWGI